MTPIERELLLRLIDELPPGEQLNLARDIRARAASRVQPDGRLRDKQMLILEELRTCFADGSIPTIRELMQRTGISSTSVIKLHLGYLHKMGLITYRPGKSRTLTLVIPEE